MTEVPWVGLAIAWLVVGFALAVNRAMRRTGTLGLDGEEAVMDGTVVALWPFLIVLIVVTGALWCLGMLVRIGCDALARNYRDNYNDAY